MNSKEFKTLFGEKAVAHGFLKAFGGWYKESTECTTVLELQKSKFGDYWLLNIKIFVKGIFDRSYSPGKDLIKSSLGHVNSNETEAFQSVFDFDEVMNDDVRVERLERLFKEHIVPFTTRASTRKGIIEMYNEKLFPLLPAVKEQIGL